MTERPDPVDDLTVDEALDVVDTRSSEPRARLEEPQVEETTDPTPPWPEPAPEAFHGLAGDVVRFIEPASEADPMALLGQFLVAFGNAVGRGPHFRVESTVHHINLFALIVGQTSRGRKGTALRHVRRLLALADEGWERANIVSGLSSGEGLIHAVRDPIYKTVPVREGKRVTSHEQQLDDPGVSDKRLLVVEEEFAATLRVAKRESSTLSATVRQAWDGSDLRVLNKNSPTASTAPHVSIIGHVTEADLKHHLDAVEVGNGFANRFLVLLARRSKELPDGGTLDPRRFAMLATDVGLALDFGRKVGEITRSEAARAHWRAIYTALTRERPGLLGALTARAEAHVARLACLFAVLDRSAQVEPVHLNAAVALWEYAEAGLGRLFGGGSGDRVADAILRALRGSCPDGLTRTSIRDLFHKNRSKEEVDAALNLLAKNGLATCRRVNDKTPGRPVERWVLSSRSFSSLPPTRDDNAPFQAEVDRTVYGINDITPIDDMRRAGAYDIRPDPLSGAAGPGLERDIPLPDEPPPEEEPAASAARTLS